MSKGERRGTCWSLACKNDADGIVKGRYSQKVVCEEHGRQFVDGGRWDEFIPFGGDVDDQG